MLFWHSVPGSTATDGSPGPSLTAPPRRGSQAPRQRPHFTGTTVPSPFPFSPASAAHQWGQAGGGLHATSTWQTSCPLRNRGPSRRQHTGHLAEQLGSLGGRHSVQPGLPTASGLCRWCPATRRPVGTKVQVLQEACDVTGPVAQKQHVHSGSAGRRPAPGRGFGPHLVTHRSPACLDPSFPWSSS